jgi:hypothetical protein
MGYGETIQMTFNKYQVIKGYLDPSMCAMFYQYCVLSVCRTDYMIANFPNQYRPDWDGEFGDKLVANTYCRYADPLFESLLLATVAPLEQVTAMNLIPTYSYWRFYQKGDELIPHIDRNSCEISVTLCLGYNGDNWPIWIKDNEQSIPIELEPGDMLVYKGCEVEHWRDPYMGLNHAQVFLHYNQNDGVNKNYLDGRPMPAIPKVYSS